MNLFAPVVGVTIAMALAGCSAVGGAIENYRRSTTKTVAAEYAGLEGKSFAVVIVADRTIQAEHPGLVEYLESNITQRLAQPANTPRAGAFAPPDEVMHYLYNNPSWNSRTRVELAKGLGGAQRLVLIEINEFRLHEPGNAYEWDGVASGTVGVFEIDSARPEDYAFQRSVNVKFPDKKGYGPNELAQSAVQSALALRFIDRASWLLYTHEEPYYPEY